MIKHTLEPAAQEIAGATSKPTFLYELGRDRAQRDACPARRDLGRIKKRKEAR